MISPLVIKPLLTAAVIAAAIFAWNWFIDYERSIGYQKAVAEYIVTRKADGAEVLRYSAARALSVTLSLITRRCP